MVSSAVSSVRLLLLLLALLTASCTVPNPAYDPGASSDGMPLIPVSDLGLPGSDATGVDGPTPTQPKPVGVDVLLVIDNSQGMSQVQKRIKQLF